MLMLVLVIEIPLAANPNAQHPTPNAERPTEENSGQRPWGREQRPEPSFSQYLRALHRKVHAARSYGQLGIMGQECHFDSADLS
jgi:hypothetical protein